MTDWCPFLCADVQRSQTSVRLLINSCSHINQQLGYRDIAIESRYVQSCKSESSRRQNCTMKVFLLLFLNV